MIIPSDSLFLAGYYYIGTVVYHLVYSFYADSNVNFKFNFPGIFTQNEMNIYFPQLDKKYKYGIYMEDG